MTVGGDQRPVHAVKLLHFITLSGKDGGLWDTFRMFKSVLLSILFCLKPQFMNTGCVYFSLDWAIWYSFYNMGPSKSMLHTRQKRCCRSMQGAIHLAVKGVAYDHSVALDSQTSFCSPLLYDADMALHQWGRCLLPAIQPACYMSAGHERAFWSLWAQYNKSHTSSCCFLVCLHGGLFPCTDNCDNFSPLTRVSALNWVPFTPWRKGWPIVIV